MTRLRGPAVKQAQRFARAPVQQPPRSPASVNGHPLGAIARRLHDPSTCVGCGLPGLMWRVSVEVVSDGRRTTIDLCERCLSSEDRAWRLRWQPVPSER